jgi:hypothetical protein
MKSLVPPSLKKWRSFGFLFAGLMAVIFIISTPSLAISATGFQGKVTNLTGAGVSGVTVTVYDALSDSIVTQSDGTYVFDAIQPGSYLVSFFNPIDDTTVYYNNKLDATQADLVSVTSGVITPGINAVMGQWGIITGKVTNSSHAGLSGITVNVYDASGNLVPNIQGVPTGADGSFTITVIPAGSYKIKYSGSSQGYIDLLYPADTTLVDVFAGVSKVLPDAVMSLANISGTVKNSSGAGIPGISIFLYDATGNLITTFTGVQTRADGSYLLGGISAANYKIEFFDPTRLYVKQFYNNKSSVALADLVPVTGTSTTANINAVLASDRPTVTAFTIPGYSRTLTVSGISVTANGDNGIAGYLLTETAAIPAVGLPGWTSASPTSYLFTSVGLKTLYAWAKSSAGNVSASMSQTVMVDPQAPALVLSTLANGASTDNAALNVSGSVTDALSGLDTLTINGATVIFDTTDGSFSHVLQLSTGLNTVTSVATDKAGNQVIDTRTITLAKTLPLLTITAPADNSKISNTVIDITGTVSGTAAPEVKDNNGSSQTVFMNGADFRATVNLAAGINTISIVTTDSTPANAAKRTITSDTSKPSLAVTDPSQDLLTKNSGYLLKGTVSNALSAVTVTVTSDGQTFPQQVVNGTFAQQLSFPDVKSYPIVVTATDESGISVTTQRNIIRSGASGDVNGDGNVDISDALLTLKYAVGLIQHTPENIALYLATADVAPLDPVTRKPMGDGQIDISDALLILKKAVNLVTW